MRDLSKNPMTPIHNAPSEQKELVIMLFGSYVHLSVLIFLNFFFLFFF